MKKCLRLFGFSLALTASLSLVSHAAQHHAQLARPSHCAVCHTTTIPVTPVTVSATPNLAVNAAADHLETPGHPAPSLASDAPRAPPAQ